MKCFVSLKLIGYGLELHECTIFITVVDQLWTLEFLNQTDPPLYCATTCIAVFLVNDLPVDAIR